MWILIVILSFRVFLMASCIEWNPFGVCFCKASHMTNTVSQELPIPLPQKPAPAGGFLCSLQFSWNNLEKLWFWTPAGWCGLAQRPWMHIFSQFSGFLRREVTACIVILLVVRTKQRFGSCLFGNFQNTAETYQTGKEDYGGRDAF